MGQRCLRITRGFGYWCFKPQVILQALRQINENDILIYADIGCEFVKKGRENLLKRLKELNQEDYLKGFELDWQSSSYCLEKFGYDLIEKTWTKMDIFDYFKAQTKPYITATPQIAATMMMMIKCSKSLKFMQEWLDLFKTKFDLFDDSPSKMPNFDTFIENRHDQSVFSVMNKLYKLKNFLYKDIEPIYDANGTEFGILCSRKSWDTMGHLFDLNGKAKFDLSAKVNVRSKTLKRFLYIGSRFLPSKKARKQCRAWLSSMR